MAQGMTLRQCKLQTEHGPHNHHVSSDSARHFFCPGWIGPGTDAEGIQLDDEAPDAPVSRLHEIIDDARDRFFAAYMEYGEGSADETGLAGQWADLYRKVMKLKRSLWAGESGYLTREKEEEILQDLIGHAILALDMLKRGQTGGRS